MTSMNSEERGDVEPTPRDAGDGEAAECTDIKPALREAAEKKDARAKQLRRNTHATSRALDGWGRMRSEDDWLRVFEEGREEYESGQFLLERLGAERYLDPKLMATLLSLRQRLIAEWGITTAAETMLVDLAVLNYYHSVRVQGWIGDLALHLEREFFGQDAFAPERVQERVVQERVRRVGEQLMPLFDRANRMVIRNLKAIKELRQGLAPAIAIGRAEHVTVTNRHNGRTALRPVKRDRTVEDG
jgi:hypothetical protein